MKRSIVFIVEKTATGFSAYAEDYPVFTVGGSMQELRINMLDAINTWMEHTGKKQVIFSQLDVKMDIPQLFSYYKEINAKGISKRIHMNEGLLSQYVNGRKKPSKKQAEKILQAVKELGQELATIELI